MNEKCISRYLRLYPIPRGSRWIKIHYRNIEVLDFEWFEESDNSQDSDEGNIDLNAIVEFSINHNKLEKLDGLRFLPNLESISIAYNKISDLNELINNIEFPD